MGYSKTQTLPTINFFGNLYGTVRWRWSAKTNDESRTFVKKKKKRSLSGEKWSVKNLAERLGKTDEREKIPFFSLVAFCLWVLRNRTIKPPRSSVFEESIQTQNFVRNNY